MKLFNVKWLQIYLACMHSFHSEPILGNLFLPWLGQGDPILGTSDFVDSLINQRRSQFQRSRRAKTGTPSYLSPPYPLAVFVWCSREIWYQKTKQSRFPPFRPTPQLLQHPSTPIPLPHRLYPLLPCSQFSTVPYWASKLSSTWEQEEGSTAALSTPSHHWAHPSPQSTGKAFSGDWTCYLLGLPFLRY